MASSFSVSTVVTSTVVIGLVALLSVLFGIPHRDIEWDASIVPLARQYGNHMSSGVVPPTVSNDDYPLIGTTIVITGATSGIGYALTNAFIRLGGTVIALGRSPSKLRRLQDHFIKETMNRATDTSTEGAQLHTFVVEMSDLASVGKVGKQIATKFDTIDILVNNAGMHALDDMFGTKLGFTVGSHPPYYDRVFVVNYLSHFLLTELLLPSLQKSNRQPTIVQTTSSYHWGVDGSDLLPITDDKKLNGDIATVLPIAARPGGSEGFYVYRTQRSYANSKLAQIYHARALNQKLSSPSSSSSSTGPTWPPETKTPRIVSFCPGWVATNIGGPDDSMATKILATIAFPVHGWGIASALHAILSPTPTTNFENDYYINSKTFLIAVYIFAQPTPPWLYQYGFRDVIANLFANFALVTQRWGAYAGPTTSSPRIVQYHDRHVTVRLELQCRARIFIEQKHRCIIRNLAIAVTYSWIRMTEEINSYYDKVRLVSFRLAFLLGNFCWSRNVHCFIRNWYPSWAQ
jgi:NAD(P)-dependent dehydrogenase (short-subunit alcohol dehydrogenase family)